MPHIVRSPFDSLGVLKQQFNQGLHELLDLQQLSTFVLVLANATQHQDIYEELKPKLKQQFDYFVKQYKAELAHGNQIDVVDEDFLVFLKLYMLGFDNIQLNQQRQEADWRCQFNHIRSFRPRRISSFHNDREITAPYDKYTFNFNKAFMAKECFWAGEIQGKQIDLFYNKYPFAELHGICVPDKEACLPQLLTQDTHQYMWQLTSQLSQTIPGIGFGYNSYGAYASVNHLHFQMFVEADGLPIVSTRWKHNNGNIEYPLSVYKSSDTQHAWQQIEQLQQNKQPYNLIFMPDECYILPRKVQGSVDVPVWSSGFTWYELAGAMLVFNQEDFKQLETSSIETLLKQLKV